jgi:uroporphyrinogen-III synthase
MPAPASTALAGLRVLVTRPTHQAPPLCQLIARAGGTPLAVPAIEITPPSDPGALERILEHLDRFDLAIFVSPNAVTRALETLRQRGRALPARLLVACVGGASARTLAEHGVATMVTPARSDSEGLLELAPLREVAGKRVVIFRGEGGRELLAETLRARGAEVEYAECYRRQRPRTDASALARDFMQQRIDVVTITSADALRNLIDMIGPLAATRLAKTPLVVVSERLRDLAHELGHAAEITVTTEASDEAIVAALDAIADTCRARQKNL